MKPLVLAAAVLTSVAQAQPIAPLRTQPVEKITVNLRFRDWGPLTIAGNTILGGNQTGTGGLFAVDAATAKLKWSFIPKLPGPASVATPPAVAGNVVITPFGGPNPGATIAVSLATGKELWRGPDPATNAAVAVDGDLAYILSKTGFFHAIGTATGKERWKFQFATNRAQCASIPVIKDGAIYLSTLGQAVPGDPKKPNGYYLFALDAKTGEERWRYRAEAPYVHPGVCLSQPVVTADTIYASGESRIYAVDRATGRDRFPAVQIRRPVEGRERDVAVSPVVEAGPYIVFITPGRLIALDKSNGRLAWELPGRYSETTTSLTVAGDVLYFQGNPSAKPAPDYRGTLHALDLKTRSILWSFTRAVPEKSWSFGEPAPVNNALWVAAYSALIKLE